MERKRKDKTLLLSEGDFILFDKAIVEARKITEKKKFKGSNAHNKQRAVCQHNGLFILDKEWEGVTIARRKKQT